jgi:hypothetical protein
MFCLLWYISSRILDEQIYVSVIHYIGWSQWARGLRHEPSSPARRGDRGFESHSRHGYVCVGVFYVCVVLCVRQSCRHSSDCSTLILYHPELVQ